MDPNETLLAALRALAAGDKEGCADYLSYYHQWRKRGGFEPRNGDIRANQTRILMEQMPS